MADYIYSIILLIIALIAIELRKNYHVVPKAELRFRARQGDVLAEKLYKAVAYDESLDGLLWIVIILCSAGSLIFFNQIAPLWLDFIAIIVFLWLAFAWLPKTAVNGLGEKLAMYLTPAVAWLLNYFHPAFEKVHSLFTKSKEQKHTGIYDKKDLIKLIDAQVNQGDSRINQNDLELIKKGLKLSDKVVGEHTANWSKIQHASANDAIGPVLLDELHKSQQQFVPVTEGDDTKNVVGIIDLTKLKPTTGLVKDIMDPNVYYLNEEDSLEDALTAITNTGHPVFIVLDKKQRVFGMITIKDVMEQLVSVDETPKDYSFPASKEDYQVPEQEQVLE